MEVTAIEHDHREQTVHNLTVADTHTYYVTANTSAVLVHNCGLGATTGAGLADSGFVNPATIRFSQSSIRGTFGNGRTVNGLADDLRSGVVQPGDVPAIRLAPRNGNYFSLDNRRLAAFQEEGVDVPYRMATADEIAAEAWKFTTRNDGLSIRIRGGS